MLQPAADGLKLFFKENVAPAERDKLLYLVGPSLAGGAALLAYAVIPWGTNSWFGHEFHWDIAHINVGLLFILGITSLGVYSLFLGGFASNSKYSLLGGLRSSAQLISYEMAVSFALIGVVILSGSLDLEKIVGSQQGLWFIVLQPLAFILYFTAAFAETNRLPFDLPEAETELIAGYHTEYSAMRFGLYFLGEYINMVTVCSIATALFLGGWLPLLAVPSLRLDPRADLVPWQGLRAPLRDDLGALDSAAAPLRQAHEFRLESAAATWPHQHRRHGHDRRVARIAMTRVSR